jgi:hypothetical protein
MAGLKIRIMSQFKIWAPAALAKPKRHRATPGSASLRLFVSLAKQKS